MGLITQADLKDQQALLKKLNKKCCCAKGSIENGCCYYEVTRAEIELLVTNGDLIKGALYKITDRGDLGLWFEAISTTELNPEGVRKMLVPAGANELGYNSFSDIADTFGNIWFGVWNLDRFTYENIVISEGDLVIWGGLVWKNLDGNIGTKVDDITLNPESWEIIPKASFTNHEYVPKLFGVYYDFENDWISSQWDEKNNKFGVEFNNDRAFTFNPVDISDWNWAYIGGPHYFSDNFCIGIWNNPSNGGLFDHASITWNHLISGAIYQNYINGVIEYNTCEGDIGINTIYSSINNNSCIGGIINNLVDENDIGVNNISFNNNSGAITGNSNNGPIEYNSCNGSISDNSNGNGVGQDGKITNNINNGDIEGNSHLGYITMNSNNGDIYLCTSTPNTCDIFNNVNNGYITGNHVADVSDTIVNK